MDETTQEQFRWKFYRLALQLNAIILLVALGWGLIRERRRRDERRLLASA